MHECMNDDCALVQIGKIMNLLEASPEVDHEIGVIPGVHEEEYATTMYTI